MTSTRRGVELVVGDVQHCDGGLGCATAADDSGAEYLLCLYADGRSSVELPPRLVLTPTPGAAVEHPHVVSLAGYGSHDAWTILAYPGAGMVPLWLAIDRATTMSRRDTLVVAAQVAEGLDALHAGNRRSTDVHVGNVFVAGTGDGLVARLGHHGLLGAADYRRLYKEHPQIARFAVVTPEELTSAATTVRSDVFQLGVLVTTMLTRRRLVLPPSLRDMGAEAVKTGLYPEADFASGLPRGAAEFVARAMAADPHDRYASAAEALAVLRGGTSRLRALRVLTELVGAPLRRLVRRPRTPAVESSAPTGDVRDDTLALPAAMMVALVLVGMLFGRNHVSDDPVPEVRTAVDRSAPRATVPVPSSVPQVPRKVLEELRRQVDAMRRVPTTVDTLQARREFIVRSLLELPAAVRTTVLRDGRATRLLNVAIMDPTEATVVIDGCLTDLHGYVGEALAQ